MKKMMKKIASILLIGTMVCGLITSCGNKDNGGSGSGASGDYSEKISFTMTNWYSMVNANAGYDLEEDEYVQWVMDKFNVEIDAWALPNSSEALSTTRLWLNAGTVPDCFLINTTMPITELRQYIALGVLKPLPDDWKDKWPNLAKMTEATGYADAVTVDGKTYAIPHAVYYGFEEYSPLPEHKSIHFRKDWAKQVGMENLGADGSVKLSELADYLKKVSDAGLCSKPYLAGTINTATELFRLANGIGNKDFSKTDKGYTWVPDSDKFIGMIEQIQNWYKTGLLDPDAYVTDADTAYEEYKNGLSPAIYASASVGTYHDMLSDIMKRDGKLPSDTDAREKLCDVYGIAAVESEDGVVYSDEAVNYYTMHAFNQNCDDAKMVRILDMMDYFCTTEGQIGSINGIPEKDWTMDEDGNFKILNEDLSAGEYASFTRFFSVWGTAEDSYSTVAGVNGYNEKEQEVVHALYKVKSEGKVLPIDMHYELLDAEAKNNYSVGVASKVTSLVVSSTNVKADWKAFVDEQSSIWKPVLNELNK